MTTQGLFVYWHGEVFFPIPKVLVELLGSSRGAGAEPLQIGVSFFLFLFRALRAASVVLANATEIIIVIEIVIVIVIIIVIVIGFFRLRSQPVGFLLFTVLLQKIITPDSKVFGKGCGGDLFSKRFPPHYYPLFIFIFIFIFQSLP